MRESAVESYLVRQVQSLNGMAEKFVSPGRRNVPDRLCLWPYGYKEFVEVKKPGEAPTGAQLRDHTRRRKLGHNVWVVSTKAEVDGYIEFCTARHLKAWDREHAT